MTRIVDAEKSLERSPAELLPRESLACAARLLAAALGAPISLVAGELSAEPGPAGENGIVSRRANGSTPSTAGEANRGMLRLLLIREVSCPDGEPLLVTDASSDPRAREVPEAVDLAARSFALVPFGGSGRRSSGALCVLGATPRGWSQSDVRALRDVAAQLATEVDLRRDALHDILTGLPNRVLFLDRLTHAVQRARRHKDFHFAVLSLDIDRFTLVNDSLGHEVGDELLISVARRLEACVRSEDTVARLGDDEFAILLESIVHDSDGGRVADRIQRSLAVPVSLGGYEVVTSATIGVALSSTELEKPTAMLQSADIAMSRAKAAGRARYEMFNREMHQRALGRLRAETELRRATDRNEFMVYYQPLIDLGTGRITELEALVRWRHPERGVVLPLEFIPLAEETGMILRIGRWVRDEACRQARVWQERFPRPVPLAVSVNVSVKELAQPGFVMQVAETIQQTGLSASSLKLEITENLVIENAEPTRAMLEELQRFGVRIYLDDFGTGYSSLGYLHRLPLDAIKIDRSFVTLMEHGDRHFQLVHTVRTLARSIGVSAVAEGVETQAQLHALRALGCEFAQGYLFARPSPPEEIELLLSQDPRW